MNNKVLFYRRCNYFDNPIISCYFELEEKITYLNSLKKVKARRDFYFEVIPCILSFVELSKNEESVKLLDKSVFKNIEEIVLNKNENLIDQLKSINKEGFDLMKIKKPLNFNTLKKAYLTAVKLNHPDIGGDTRKMQIINEAYSQFHKIISISNKLNEDGNVLIKSSKDYVYYRYIDLINVLVDSWDIKGAYKYLKEAIDNGIFSDISKDTYNYFEYFCCIEVCKRLTNIGFNKEGLKILEYVEAFVKNIDNENKDYYIENLNILKSKLKSNKRYRVVISHKIQADNAIKLEIITDKKYNEYIKKFSDREKNEKELNGKLEKKLLVSNFLIPLPNEEALFKKITKVNSTKLIPEMKYFQYNIYEISKAQQWEYFKAFSNKTDLKLIKKYVFVRLYSYLNSAFGNFSKNLCNNIVNELEVIVNLFKDDNSVQYYSNKILESLNILLSIDNKEAKKRLLLIKKYCTYNSKTLDTPITMDFMEFITIKTDEIEKVVNKNMSYTLIKHYDMIDRRKLDEQFLNPLKKYEDNAWFAIRTLKKTDLNEACKHIETYVEKGLKVIEKLYAPEWFGITFWIEELCKINTRLSRNENSLYYLNIFFKLPYNKRGRTNESIVKRLEERLLKLEGKKVENTIKLSNKNN